MSNKVQWNEQTSQSYEKFRTQGTSLITHIYPELQKLNIFQPGMRVLAIGPGGGWFEVALAKDFGAKITFVEPSEQFIGTFKEQMEELNLEEQIDEVFVGKFEDFNSHQKYDLVIAIHSWHYIGLDAEQLKRAISFLAPGGTLSIVQTSEAAFSKRLKDLLHPDGHSFIEIEELSRFCDLHELRHQLIKISKIRPAERYLKNSELTEYAESWLSLMGRISYDQIPEKTRDEVKKILEQFSENGLIDDAWGVVLIPGASE